MARAGDEAADEAVAVDDLHLASPLLAPASASVEAAFGFGEESAEQRRARMRSLQLVYILGFINGMQFSALIPAIWPMLQSQGGTKDFLGVVTAAYSVGMAISSPLMGIWARYHPVKMPLLLGTATILVGNAMYTATECFSKGRQTEIWMLSSRVIVGVGGGGMATARAYCANATTLGERSRTMTLLTMAQSIGFIVGPVITAGLAIIKDGFAIGLGNARFDYRTAPAWFGVLLGVVQLVMLTLFFTESPQVKRSRDLARDARRRRVKHADTAPDTPNGLKDPESAEKKDFFQPDYDKVAISCLIALSFGAALAFALYETLGTVILQDEYGMSSHASTQAFGILLCSAGVIGVPTFLLGKALLQKLGSQNTTVFVAILLVIAQVALIPYGLGNTTSKYDSCSEEWCDRVPQIPFAQFIVGNIMEAVSYAFTIVVASIVLSMIVGPWPQGPVMGMQTMMNGIARIIGPAAVTVVYKHLGPQILFTSLAGLEFLILVFILCFRPRLKAHAMYGIT